MILAPRINSPIYIFENLLDAPVATFDWRVTNLCMGIDHNSLGEC